MERIEKYGLHEELDELNKLGFELIPKQDKDGLEVINGKLRRTSVPILLRFIKTVRSAEPGEEENRYNTFRRSIVFGVLNQPYVRTTSERHSGSSENADYVGVDEAIIISQILSKINKVFMDESAFIEQR